MLLELKKIKNLNHLSIKFLPWDSEFFGFNIFEVKSLENKAFDSNSLNELIEFIKEHKGRLIYYKCDYNSKDNPSKILGRNPLDIKIAYSKVIVSNSFIKDDHIRVIKNSNEDLYELGQQAGYESRFKKDTKFSEDNFVSLYRIWIDNSLNGKLADYVLGYYECNKLEGFITLKLEEEYAQIGLIAVESKARRKGIGKQLIKFAESLAYANNCTKIIVETQKGNKGACGFYESLGYTQENATCIYHLWIS